MKFQIIGSFTLPQLVEILEFLEIQETTDKELPPTKGYSTTSHLDGNEGDYQIIIYWENPQHPNGFIRKIIIKKR